MADIFAHHAYCFVGSADELIAKLLAEFEEEGIAVRGNPDVRVERHARLGIDEARALCEAASRRAVSRGKKIFVIAADELTREAQNALLKVIEEPTPGTHFFLIVPLRELLLPTLRSRLSRQRTRGVSEAFSRGAAAAFLADSLPGRLRRVRELLGAREEREVRLLNSFLDSLERTLYGDGWGDSPDVTRAASFETLLSARRALFRQGASPKLLLEHVALALPRVF